MSHQVVVGGKVHFWNKGPLKVIAGPCLLESRDLALTVAEHIANVCRDLQISWVFKASFKKANRTSLAPSQGVSFEEAVMIFQEIRETYGCPVLTDVHETGDCEKIAPYVDILQIPAFLCRQTALLEAAIATGLPLNVKKGQFLSPPEMLKVAEKIRQLGGQPPLLCERGACFGYNDLVSDMRSLTILGESGYPVIFDGTHSVQKPGAQGDRSGGERRFVETLSRAAVAVGVAGVFLETHPDPDKALSDGPNMVPLAFLKPLLSTLKILDAASKDLSYQSFSTNPLGG